MTKRGNSSSSSTSNPMSIIRRETANPGVLMPRYAPHLLPCGQSARVLCGASNTV